MPDRIRALVLLECSCGATYRHEGVWRDALTSASMRIDYGAASWNASLVGWRGEVCPACVAKEASGPVRAA